MINVKLPDGSIRQFEKAVTVAAVAAAIGPGLAKAALAGKVDGRLVDTSFVINFFLLKDCCNIAKKYNEI